MSRTLLSFIGAVAVASVAAQQPEQPMLKKANDTSPDGRFLVRRFGEEIEITDLSSHRVYRRIGVLPSYIVQWLPDSKTIAVLQHLAGGSEATVVHFDGHKWRAIQATPKNVNYDHIDIVEVTPHDGHLQLLYRADILSRQHRASHFLITLDVDLAHQARREHVQHISYQEYAGLQPVGPP
jgi:hypothetical protein